MRYEEKKLKQILEECKKHASRIERAAKKMDQFMPIPPKGLSGISEDNLGLIDQFLFRFQKLQDTMGDKLFRAYFLNIEEDKLAKGPFIDLLNRLEKLNFLTDKQIWLELREIRNNLAHEYPEDEEILREAINSAFIKRDYLTGVLDIFIKQS